MTSNKNEMRHVRKNTQQGTLVGVFVFIIFTCVCQPIFGPPVSRWLEQTRPEAIVHAARPEYQEEMARREAELRSLPELPAVCSDKMTPLPLPTSEGFTKLYQTEELMWLLHLTSEGNLEIVSTFTDPSFFELGTIHQGPYPINLPNEGFETLTYTLDEVGQTGFHPSITFALGDPILFTCVP